MIPSSVALPSSEAPTFQRRASPPRCYDQQPLSKVELLSWDRPPVCSILDRLRQSKFQACWCALLWTWWSSCLERSTSRSSPLWFTSFLLVTAISISPLHSISATHSLCPDSQKVTLPDGWPDFWETISHASRESLTFSAGFHFRCHP